MKSYEFLISILEQEMENRISVSISKNTMTVVLFWYKLVINSGLESVKNAMSDYTIPLIYYMYICLFSSHVNSLGVF